VDGGRTAQSLRRPEPGEAERAGAGLHGTARGVASLRGADGRGADGEEAGAGARRGRHGGRGEARASCTKMHVAKGQNCTKLHAADGAGEAGRGRRGFQCQKMHPEKFGGKNFKLNVPTALFV